MEKLHLLDLFQGLATLAAADPKIFWGRIGLMLFGFLLVYLGKKGILEALLMIPMGLGMAAVNAGVMFFEANKVGTLFLDLLVEGTDATMNILQIDWLQPIYPIFLS